MLRRFLCASAAVLLAMAMVTASPARGATQPPKATGGVGYEYLGQTAYLSFSAFDANPVKGQVDFTNFTVPYDFAGALASEHTNIWSLPTDPATIELDFSVTSPFVAAGPFVHHMTVASITPTGLTSMAFEASGSYDFDGTKWLATGTIAGTTVDFSMFDSGDDAFGYVLNATGTVAPDGSMAGTAWDTLGRTENWWTPAASAFEALSFEAPVTCAKLVNPTTFRFGFTMPANLVPPAGYAIVAEVTDGGSPALGHDSLKAVGSTSCSTAVAADPVTFLNGNLVVH